jgi:hypothetical protein
MADKKIVEVKIQSNVKEFTTDLNAAGQSASDLSNNLGGNNGGNKFLTDLKNNAINLIPGLKGATSAVDGLGKQLYVLAANPIGATIAAVVVTLKFLYEAFQNTVSGGKQIKAVFEGFDAVATKAKDTFFAVGRALASLDFSGAAKEIKNFGNEAGKTFETVRKLTEEQQKNDKARKIAAVEQSKTDLLLVKSRDILTDELSTLKEKKKALEEVTKVEIKTSAEKVRIAQKDLDILKEKQKAIGGQAAIKMNQEIRDSEIALNQAQTENAQTGIKLNRQRKMLARQEKADSVEALAKKKEQQKAEEEKAKKDLEKLDARIVAQRNYETNIAAEEIAAEEERKKRAIEKQKQIDQENGAELNSYATYQANITAEEQKQAEQRKRIAESEKEAKREAMMAVAQSFENASAIIGRETAAGKALAVASATISTFVAAQSAYENAQKIPYVGFALAPINAALAIAAGLKNVQNILSVDVPGSKSGGMPSGGGGFGGGGNAPRFNVVGQSTANQVAQAVGQNIPPVKAYVVSGDVTTAQALDRNKITSATLG